MTLGPTPSVKNTIINDDESAENVFIPSARINPGLAVKNNVLYMYGGLFEDGDRTYTLNDFYSLGNIWFIPNCYLILLIKIHFTNYPY